MNQKAINYVFILPVLLAMVVNLNVLQNGYGWDDELIIQGIKPPDQWWTLFLPNLEDSSAGKSYHSYYRPLISISYSVDFLLWGNNPFGFHLSVWLAHALNTLLVVLMAQRLLMVDGSRLFVHGKEKKKFGNWKLGNYFPFSIFSFSDSSSSDEPTTHDSRLTTRHFIPVLAGSLFAVHPIHAEAVAWIAGRNDVFCTTFLLASFLLYTQTPYTETGKTGNWKLKTRMAYVLSMFFFFLALLTKEAAVGLVVLFPLYDVLVLGQESKKLGNWKLRNYFPFSNFSFSHFLRIIFRFIPPLLILGTYFWMRSVKLAAPYGGVSSETILSQSPIPKAVILFGYYLKTLLLPFPHQPFISGLPSSPLFLALSGITLIGLGLAGVFSFIHRDKIMCVGLFWTPLILAPGMAVTLLNVTPTQAAERYVYGASAGFVLLVAWGLSKIFDTFQSARLRGLNLRWVGIAFALILLTTWSWESWRRNSVWRSPLTFWQVAAVSANDGFPYRELGIHYAKQGRYNEAEDAYRTGIRIYEETPGSKPSDMATSLNSLGVLYYEQGRYSLAEPVLRKALEIRKVFQGFKPLPVAETLNNTALVYHSQGRYEEAIPFYQRALRIQEEMDRPDQKEIARILNNLASLYDRQDRSHEAEQLYRRALSIRERIFRSHHPDIAQTLNNLAALYYRQQRYIEAEPLYQRALLIYEETLRPDHPDLAQTLINLAALYDTQGNPSKAEPLYRRSIGMLEKSLGPVHPAVQTGLENYALMLRKAGRDLEAEGIETRIKRIRRSKEDQTTR